MKINQKEIKPIELQEIYDNYFDYLKPIMEYYINVYGHINDIDELEAFIDNTAINGYGFCKYNGKLYIIELATDDEELNNYNYFVEDGAKYILIPIG